MPMNFVRVPILHHTEVIRHIFLILRSWGEASFPPESCVEIRRPYLPMRIVIEPSQNVPVIILIEFICPEIAPTFSSAPWKRYSINPAPISVKYVR